MAPKGFFESFSFFGQPKVSTENKYTLLSFQTLYSQLSRVHQVNERNKDNVVESLRTISELIIWGEKHDPAIFEFFLEKNVLSKKCRQGLGSLSFFLVEIMIFYDLLDEWHRCCANAAKAAKDTNDAMPMMTMMSL